MLIRSQRTCASTVPAVSMVMCCASRCVKFLGQIFDPGAIIGSPPVITTCDAP